jgi:hypothetical protein
VNPTWLLCKSCLEVVARKIPASEDLATSYARHRETVATRAASCVTISSHKRQPTICTDQYENGAHRSSSQRRVPSLASMRIEPPQQSRTTIPPRGYILTTTPSFQFALRKDLSHKCDVQCYDKICILPTSATVTRRIEAYIRENTARNHLIICHLHGLNMSSTIRGMANEPSHVLYFTCV